ncbi:mitoguardin 2 [Salmo salar]|uniref:Mitoguardin 2 n=1 Tax=Salmo salar TaxID=8030 RepID=A0A1S3N2B6_SALSA|nr:mitoguardin 2-like [Salmo salar]
MYPNSWRPYLPESEDDAFINIKLSAIRQAFELILRDPEAKHFLKETGKSLIGGLLSLAGKSSEGFGLVWEKLMAFTENPTNWPDIVDECQEAGMHTVGFYDIFYESIVLKVLECQEYIPAILKPTLRTPWISEGTKKTTVMFYAWSQIKKKRECLMRPDALYHHLYEVFDYTDPEIMWAAYGPQSKTKEFYILLRGRILSFIQQMFSLDRKRYESPESLAVKVLSNWKRLVRFLQFYLDENKYSLLISMNHKERGISV